MLMLINTLNSTSYKIAREIGLPVSTFKFGISSSEHVVLIGDISDLNAFKLWYAQGERKVMKIMITDKNLMNNDYLKNNFKEKSYFVENITKATRMLDDLNLFETRKFA